MKNLILQKKRIEKRIRELVKHHLNAIEREVGSVGILIASHRYYGNLGVSEIAQKVQLPEEQVTEILKKIVELLTFDDSKLK